MALLIFSSVIFQERERAVAAAATDAQHAELVEKINQLTILRESNATLRADSEAHSKRVRQLDIKVRSMTAELEPLREQARVAKAELEARNLHVQKLEEENKKWQERNAQLLTKVRDHSFYIRIRSGILLLISIVRPYRSCGDAGSES